MSGAEIVAAVSFAASIASLVDFTTKVIKLAREVQKGSAFADVLPQLELFLADVEQIRHQVPQSLSSGVDRGALDTFSRVVDGCNRQVTTMYEIMSSMKFPESASHFRKSWIGLRNLGKEARIKEIMAILDQYKATLSLHLLTGISQASAQSNKPKLFLVPKRRVARFVGRRGLLQSLKHFLTTRSANSPRVAVLTGLGGQGKTQIALELCSQCSGEFDVVLWINARSRSAALIDFKAAGNALSHGTKDVRGVADSEIVSFVHGRLDDAVSWLMIFDNYDDPANFIDITDFFPWTTKPPSSNGSIIITSRLNSSERLGTPFRISGLTHEEGVELLLRSGNEKSFSMKDQEDAKLVVERLGGLALAIDQAGSYISARHMPMQTFLQIFESRKQSILTFTPSTWEYNKDPNDGQALSAFTTWELSFEQIANEHLGKEAIAEFLAFLAFLGSVHVNEYLLSTYPQYRDSFLSHPMDVFLSQGNWNSAYFQDTVVALADLSLIQVIEYDGGNMLISLHPIIKEWLQLRLDQATQKLMVRDAINFLALFIAMNEGIDMTYKSRGAVLLHIDACETHVARFLTSAESLLEYGGYLEGQQSVLARFYACHDREESAIYLFSQALELQTMHLSGANDISTMATANELASLLLRQHKYLDAESILVEVIRGKRQHFEQSPNDIRITNSVNELGIVYSFLGRYDDAEELFTQNLESFKTNPEAGPRHFMTSYNNLAEIKLHRGKLEEAKNLLDLAAASGKKLQSEHASQQNDLSKRNELLCQIKINQARVFHLMGDQEASSQAYLEVIGDFIFLLGPKHSKTLAAGSEYDHVKRGLATLQQQVLEESNWGARLMCLGKNYVSMLGGPESPKLGSQAANQTAPSSMMLKNLAQTQQQSQHDFLSNKSNFGIARRRHPDSNRTAWQHQTASNSFPASHNAANVGIQMQQSNHNFINSGHDFLRKQLRDANLTPRQEQRLHSRQGTRRSGRNPELSDNPEPEVIERDPHADEPPSSDQDYNSRLQYLTMMNRAAQFNYRQRRIGNQKAQQADGANRK